MTNMDKEKLLARIDKMEQGMWQNNFPYDALRDEIEAGNFDLPTSPQRESPLTKDEIIHIIDWYQGCGDAAFDGDIELLKKLHAMLGGLT